MTIIRHPGQDDIELTIIEPETRPVEPLDLDDDSDDENPVELENTLAFIGELTGVAIKPRDIAAAGG